MLDQLLYPSFSSLQGALYPSILCGQFECFEGMFEPDSIVERWIDVWLSYRMTCSILSSGISQALTGGETLSHSLRTRRKQLSTSNLKDTQKNESGFPRNWVPRCNQFCLNFFSKFKDSVTKVQQLIQHVRPYAAVSDHMVNSTSRDEMTTFIASW